MSAEIILSLPGWSIEFLPSEAWNKIFNVQNTYCTHLFTFLTMYHLQLSVSPGTNLCQSMLYEPSLLVTLSPYDFIFTTTCPVKKLQWHMFCFTKNFAWAPETEALNWWVPFVKSLYPKHWRRHAHQCYCNVDVQFWMLDLTVKQMDQPMQNLGAQRSLWECTVFSSSLLYSSSPAWSDQTCWIQAEH